MTCTPAELYFLEQLSDNPDYRECSPPTGNAPRLVARGLLEQIEPDGFHPGQFKLTDAGREYLKLNAAPKGEW